MSKQAAPCGTVLVARGIADQQSPASFLTLPHPKTGAATSFLLSGGGLQEINRFKPAFGSWFVGDSVLQDGSLLLATPVDVLLLLLPLLETGRGTSGAGGAGLFKDAEELVCGAWPHARMLLEGPTLPALACVCDAKPAGGQTYYRLNDDKVLAWLRCKVEQARAGLLALPNSPYASMDAAALTAYAAGLLGEYLTEAWASRLAGALGLAGQEEPLPPDFFQEPWEERPAQQDKRPRLDPKAAAKAKAVEARQANKAAKLAKEASGMRKLSAFFGAKPKAC